MPFDGPYTSSDLRPFFRAHSDLPGMVELYLPGEAPSLKLTLSKAEDLLTNLEIQIDLARAFGRHFMEGVNTNG